MSELELYKFINEHAVEYHWLKNDGIDDVIIFPLFSQIEPLHQLFKKSYFDDSGIPCALKDGYFAIWMNDICEYYGIEMKNVFPEPTNV